MTDDAFLTGTVVMLSSFQHHNSWFDGDIVIINDGLSQRARETLSTFPRVQYHQVSYDLKQRLAPVIAQHPHMAAKLPIFFSLEAFALSAYERVLYVDSDVLCQGDASELMSTEGALLCSPDQAYFRQQVRDTVSYVPRAIADVQPGDAVMESTFNAGIMTLVNAALGSDVYAALLEHVEPSTWSGVRTGHTDSVLLNRHFRGVWTPVSEKYNYLVSKTSAAYRLPRLPLHEAVFVHYLGEPKPWREAVPIIADDERAAAFALWRQAAGTLVNVPMT